MINFLNMVLLMLLPKWRTMFLFLSLYFTLTNDAAEAKGPFGIPLIFSNFTNVNKFRYDSDNVTTLIPHLENVRNVAYDYRAKQLFYELDTMIINRTTIGTQPATTQVVVEASLENNLYGMAVDWVTKKLYFTNEETNHVTVSRYDGKYRRVLVSRGLDQPRGIAVLPSMGYMFVTDWGEKMVKIERFNMDGTGRKIIVKTNIKSPFCITVDVKTNLVYWGDALHSKIESMTVNGTDRKVLRLPEKHPPHHLTAFNGQLFWSDAKTRIYSGQMGRPRDIRYIDKIGGRLIQPFGLDVYTKEKQPMFDNGCRHRNGGCSHLCLLRPGGYTCACPTGIAMREDNRTCEKGMKQFLLIARRKDILIMSLDADRDVDVILPIKGIQHGIGIEYDVKLQKVYWADINTESINRAFLNGSGFEEVISYDIKAPDHLAIDWIARNIYWTESSLNRIEVARIDGTDRIDSRKIIVSDGLDEPRGIVVDPADGKIYWTDWGNNSKIERSDLDGDNREVLVDSSKWEIRWPNGITLDYMNRKLYWVDAKYNSVSSYDLHSKKLGHVNTKTRHPFGITVLGSYLYLTDWHRLVTKYHLESGESERIKEDISDIMGIKGVNTEPAYGMNDCYWKKNNCSHLCFHKPHKGSICACPTRMELKSDRKTCKMPSGFLLYSVNSGIRKMSIDTYQRPRKLHLKNANQASLMDTYYKTGRIFWLDEPHTQTEKSPSINWALLDGSGFESIVEAGLSNVQGLAVDWMSENIYWIHHQHRIEVARVDGRFRKLLVLKNQVSTMQMQFLLVNPKESKMFWFQTDRSRNLSLWEANLDGTKQSKLISIPKVIPKSCTIDYDTSTIYWIQHEFVKGVESIESFHYGLKKKTTVVAEVAPNCRGLLFFDGSLIYADHEVQEIKKVYVEQSQRRTGAHVLVKGIEWVLDIKAYHGSVQTGVNVCSVNNGKCQHLCIALHLRSHKCACANHYTLNSDHKTCSPPTNFMLYSSGKTIMRALLGGKKEPDAPLPVPARFVHGITKFQYDVVRGHVYWLNVVKKQLVGTRGDGKVVTSNLPTESPHDFSVDTFSNTVYWTDDKLNSIKFLHLGTSRNGTVVQKYEMYFPRKICVFSELGRMFWTSEFVDESTGIDDSQTHMLSSTLAGTDIRDLLQGTRSLQGVDLVHDLQVDHVTEKLYWMNRREKTIYSMSVHGGTPTPYTSKYMRQPLSFGISGRYLYWIDGDTSSSGSSSGGSKSKIYRTVKTNTTSDGLFFKALPQSSVPHILLVNTTRANESHPCVVDNGGCSHICSIDYSLEHDPKLHTPVPLCSCPLRMTTDDGRNCKPKDGCKDEKKIFCAEDSKCYDASLKCNFHNDCADGSDEHDCNFPVQPCPSTHLIPCGPTYCIGTEHQCDGNRDCPHGTDEENCQPCPDQQHMCDHDVCLTPEKVCDGNKDCRDGSDEPDGKCPPRPVNSTTATIPKTEHEKKRMVAGIISGVIICVIVIMFTFLLWFKLCNSKKNGSRDHHVNGAVWSLAQLSQNNTESMTSDDKNSHAKSSVSTYISAMSQNTEPSFYDRNNVTGASSTTALSGYSHLPYNPPPSPMTQRALSTITESNGPYGYSSCEHCRSTIKEVPLSEVDHNDPPPTLASTLLLEDVEMYCPIQQQKGAAGSGSNKWEVNSSSCSNCHTLQTKCRSSNKSRRSNHTSSHPPPRRGSSYINNFNYEHTEASISELEPLQDSWIYGSEPEIQPPPRFQANSIQPRFDASSQSRFDASSQPRFDSNSSFVDSNKRLFCLDPPPTPCTNYMSEDEARPPSPTDTEVSLAYRLINTVDSNYAPPPSPTSQL